MGPVSTEESEGRAAPVAAGSFHAKSCTWERHGDLEKWGFKIGHLIIGHKWGYNGDINGILMGILIGILMGIFMGY